jgi:hypothetical protein
MPAVEQYFTASPEKAQIGDTGRAVFSQNLNPYILVMQPAQNCDACDAAELLGAPRIRRILSNEMRSDLIVIRGVVLQKGTQLRFVEHDQAIEAFAPD